MVTRFLNLLPYIYYHFKSISKNFQTEIIAELESITLFSHSSRKKAPVWSKKSSKNSNGILICNPVIAGTRIIKKYWKWNIWQAAKKHQNSQQNFQKHVKYLIFYIL